jgi:hypothetical protein
MRSEVHVVDHSIDAETGDNVLVGDPDVGDARRSVDRGNRPACAILVRSLHAHHSIDGCFECERPHGRGLPHATGLLLVAVGERSVHRARDCFRPGRKMVSVVFRGERVRPCPQPRCPGLFLWKTYRYGDEAPPPPPWSAHDAFLVLLVARAAGRTSRRRLVHPPNG